MDDLLMPPHEELEQAYREWWMASYCSAPNEQNTKISAAWARHVLDTFCVCFDE